MSRTWKVGDQPRGDLEMAECRGTIQGIIGVGIAVAGKPQGDTKMALQSGLDQGVLNVDCTLGRKPSKHFGMAWEIEIGVITRTRDSSAETLSIVGAALRYGD